MARGWESKSVEAQMENAKDAQPSSSKAPLTDGEKKDRHERDSLKLSRAYIVHQIEASTNERYTESLKQALQEIDQKLAKLGNSR
jgi:hypothetical protein